jgi:hypothetical protein
MKTNFLKAAIIEDTLADESMTEVDRVIRLAIVSPFGADAPSMIRDRALAIGQAVKSTTEDLRVGAGDGYPKGFMGAYVNKSLEGSL